MCIYSCRPKGRTGAAIAVSLFFFCSSMAFSAVGLNNQLRRLFFLTAAVLLVICFAVVKRFLATTYSYGVYSDGETDLLVYEHTLAEREPRAVCRVAVSDIKEIYVSSGKDKRTKKCKNKSGAARCYNYTVSIFERDHMTVSFFDGETECEMILTRDDGLINALKMIKGDASLL